MKKAGFYEVQAYFPLPPFFIAAGDSIWVLLSRAKPCGDLRKEGLIGVAACKEKANSAGIVPDPRPDLEEPRPNRAAGGLGELGPLQGQPTHRLHQAIGGGGEQQAQLIRPPRVTTGPISKQVQLLLFDPVFHLAAGTIEFLIKGLCRPG